MNNLPLESLLTQEEELALQDLSEALVVDINSRLSRVIKRLRLKKVLKMFDIKVAGLSVRIDVLDEYVEEIEERCEDESRSDDTPNYMI
jgi:hypothetical protein